jgi:hypothetical protein
MSPVLADSPLNGTRQNRAKARDGAESRYHNLMFYSLEA